MKTTSLIAALTMLAAGAVSAQTLITGFTFETSIPTTAGPVAAETGVGTASITHSVTTPAPTYSSPAGNGSVHSYSSNGWAVGDYYQFSLSTTGFTGIYVAYGQTGSNTGPGSFNLQYSVNNGATFTALPSYTLTNDAWAAAAAKSVSFKTFDLTSVTALNNAATVIFRVVDLSTVAITGGTVAATGTNRIDDFNVSTGGTITPAVPEPASIAYMVGGLGCLGLLVLRRRTA